MDEYNMMKGGAIWGTRLNIERKIEIWSELSKGLKIPVLDYRLGPATPWFRFSSLTQFRITQFLEEKGELWYFSQN